MRYDVTGIPAFPLDDLEPLRDPSGTPVAAVPTTTPLPPDER
ncbi:hypothetical protein [Virgisporangium aurantiacum]|nr:hypothetical protein [Virgisporangium aurantiacum]